MNKIVNELYFYILSFGAGLGIGLFYFGGLWLTTRHLVRASRPALLIATSFLGRLAISLVAFYMVADGQWERLLVSIAGFFIARFFLMRYFGKLKRQKV
jgi:F1F0 ATPase subunit 2